MINDKKMEYEFGENFAFAIEEFICEKFPEYLNLELAVETITYFERNNDSAYFIFTRSSIDAHRYVEFVINGVSVDGDCIRPYSIEVASHGYPASGIIKDVWQIDYERWFH